MYYISSKRTYTIPSSVSLWFREADWLLTGKQNLCKHLSELKSESLQYIVHIHGSKSKNKIGNLSLVGVECAATTYPGFLRLLLVRNITLGESNSERELIGRYEYNETIESYSLTG